MMKRVVLLNTLSGDWQGIYVDGRLIEEGHTIGEGCNMYFWVNLAHVYNISVDDIIVRDLIGIDSYDVENIGNFPLDLFKLKGRYDT